MKREKKRLFIPLFTILLLFCSACADRVEPSPSPQAAQGFDLHAAFRRSDGGTLAHSTVRFQTGEVFTDYPLDENGQTRAEGLPRQGELGVTLLEDGEEALGSMTLFLAQGAVIDASMDREGRGHVTLRGDTQDLALDFTLYGDGSLRCALRLDGPAAPGEG